jgi:hypothetical protein
MNTKSLKGVGTAVSLLLPICTALMSNPALAVDAVGGAANNGAINVGAVVNCAQPGNWTILETVSFTNPTQRYCTATGSADAFRPTTANGESTYYFTVSNQPNPICNQGQERTLMFWNQGGIWDNRVKEITTTGGWMAPANADPGYFTFPALGFNQGHTLYFLARKLNAATPNLIVDDASLTVTCTDNRLVPPLGLVPASTDPLLVP